MYMYRNFSRGRNLHQHKFQFDSASLDTSALSEVLEQKLGLRIFADFCSIFAGFLGYSYIHVHIHSELSITENFKFSLRMKACVESGEKGYIVKKKFSDTCNLVWRGHQTNSETILGSVLSRNYGT